MRIVASLLLFIICFFTNSCQKELSVNNYQDSSIIIKPPVVGSFTAKVDGASFVADKVTAITRIFGLISIVGQATNGDQIAFTVLDSGVHVYTLDIDGNNFGAYSKKNDVAYGSNGGSTSDESGGTLSITSIDTVNKTMSGTFSMKVFRATDNTKKVITEGVFTNISYDSQIILPPANSTDTFRVKVDGTPMPVSYISAISFFGMITISGSDQSFTQTAGVTVIDTVTPGTYDLSSFGPEYVGQYNIGTSVLTSDSGTVTILEHNPTTKRIRGTFEFPASELLGTKTATLTEGYFSVVYQ